MPHEQMDAQKIAAYLHMDIREVNKLAARGQIPCRKVGGNFVFRKGQVDHWVEAQMHEMHVDRLARIEKGVSKHHGFEDELWNKPLVYPLIPDKGLAVPFKARTRDSAIRALVKLADSVGMVYAPDELRDEIRKREELCATALIPGVALPHPRHPVPYDIAESFVVVGLTPSGIPYGAPDGSLTRLFFLICCKDERTHLHVLARLARMLQQGPLDEMLHCDSPTLLRELLVRCENDALSKGL